MRLHLPFSLPIALALVSTLLPPTYATKSSKRGLGYTGDTSKSNNNLLLSNNSPVSWYYTWSLSPATAALNDTLPFLPLVHNPSEITSLDKSLNDTLATLPASSTALLTFNEPDGTTDSGGSEVKPSDAAKAYLEKIAPLRGNSSNDDKEGNRAWRISHPVVTGSERGLNWLGDFNESCYDLNPKAGCPADFVAAHWYGDLNGLKTWIDNLASFYNGSSGESGLVGQSKDAKVEIWITEFALPQASDGDAADMLRQSLEVLDGDERIAKYAWFGAWEQGQGKQEWAGDGSAFFDGNGALTEVGAAYLGSGFEAGEKGSGGCSDLRVSLGWLGMVATIGLWGVW